MKTQKAKMSKITKLEDLGTLKVKSLAEKKRSKVAFYRDEWNPAWGSTPGCTGDPKGGWGKGSLMARHCSKHTSFALKFGVWARLSAIRLCPEPAMTTASVLLPAPGVVQVFEKVPALFQMVSSDNFLDVSVKEAVRKWGI